MEKPKPSGEYMPHAERARRTGRVRVDVYVSAVAGARLVRLAGATRTRAQVVESAILAFGSAENHEKKRAPKKSSG